MKSQHDKYHGIGLIGFLIVALSLLALGCASPNKTAYQTLGVVGVTANSAMQGWAAWVNAGKADADEIETVKGAWQKYQAAYKLAIDAGSASSGTNNTSALTAAVSVVAECGSDLVAVITKFLPTDSDESKALAKLQADLEDN